MSTERLRAAFEGMAVGMILKGAEGETLESNPALRRMLGYGEEELRGMTRSDYTHPEDAGRDAELYRQLLAGERDSFRMEKRYVRKDGSVMWGRLSVSRIEGAEGEPAFAVGVVEDITESREAAQEIERLNHQNWLILDSAGEGIYGLDAEGKTTFVNPAATAMTGFEPEDLIGKSQHEVVHHSRPDGTPYPREECPIYAALTDGEVHHVDDEIFWRKDGTSFPVEYTSTPIREDGEVTGAVVTFTDATERKGMEQALRRSESSLATAQRIAHLGNWDYDVTKDEARWSEEMYRIFGFAPRQFVPRYRTFLNSVHPEDRDLIRSSVRKALYEEKQGSVDYRVVRPDGDVRAVQSRYEVVRDVSGRAVKLVGTVHDITERKRAEEALRQSEERYRTLVETVPAVTYTDRAIGSYPNVAVYTSPQIEALVGYSVEEWLDPERDLWEESLHPEDRAWVLAVDGHSRASGESFAEEYRLISKDGSVVWVRDEAALMRNEAGEPLYWQGVLIDVTERKKAEEALKKSEEHFRALTQNSSDVVTLLRAVGTIRYQSPSIERILGYRPEEMIGENAFDYVHPDDRERVEMAFAEGLVDPRRRPSAEYRIRHKDGSWVWLESVGTNLLDDPGVGEYVVNSRDVTERKRAEEALTEAEERYRTVVEEQTELVCRFLPDLTLTFVNVAYCRYFGQEPQELIDESFLGHIPEEDHAYYVEDLSELTLDNPTRTVEHRVFGAEGELRWQQWTDTAIFDEEGRIVQYQSVGRDVTERKALEERLEHQAFHDPLTDLPNRHLFVDRLKQAFRRTRRKKSRQGAVLFMDLDDFKAINDSLGHEAGDLLLTVVSQRLRRCLRPEDTLARFGGDEFVVLIEDIERSEDIVRVAERIVEGLREPFIVEGRELFLRASIGVALGTARQKSPEDLLRYADTAMYEAKQAGLDYRVFDPSMYERAVGRLEMKNELRKAIEAEEFVVHYQPIANLQTGEMWGVEALVRWDHPERGLLDPWEFMAVAEQSGIVVPMGEGVLEEACRQAKEWQEEHPRIPPLVVSVNLSARQLQRPDTAQVVERVLKKTGLESRYVRLDITETVCIKALEGNTQALDELKRLGVCISIDDFGTGYSSLAYLKRLPADTLKIDKSLVKGIGEDLEDTAIVGMVIELAHTLGMETIAEGVGSEAQATLLKEMDCDMAQGFYFSKPLPPERTIRFLAEERTS